MINNYNNNNNNKSSVIMLLFVSLYRGKAELSARWLPTLSPLNTKHKDREGQRRGLIQTELIHYHHPYTNRVSLDTTPHHCDRKRCLHRRLRHMPRSRRTWHCMRARHSNTTSRHWCGQLIQWTGTKHKFTKKKKSTLLLACAATTGAA